MRKLLFFYSDWCSPCKFYAEQFIKPLEKKAGKRKVQRVNAQNEPFDADKYNVDKLPCVVLVDGNKTMMRRTGAIDIDDITDYLKGVKDYGDINH